MRGGAGTITLFSHKMVIFVFMKYPVITIFLNLNILTAYGHMLIMSITNYRICHDRNIAEKWAVCPIKTTSSRRGIPASLLEEVVLTLDEFEAIRLADYEGLYQEDGAKKMNISRQTFGRIIETAHKKIADVLINGKALKIEGGDVSIEEMKRVRCPHCKKEYNSSISSEDTFVCPRCHKQ